MSVCLSVRLSVRDGRTDGQTDRRTCNLNTGLCTKVHRAVKNGKKIKNIPPPVLIFYQPATGSTGIFLGLINIVVSKF